MKKTICDFCGREMKTTSDLLEPISNYNFCISRYGNKLDICDDCRKSFNEWWNQRKKLGEVGETNERLQ